MNSDWFDIRGYTVKDRDLKALLNTRSVISKYCK